MNNDSTKVSISTMKPSTFEALCEQLHKELQRHPHKDELLTLMAAQVSDDTLLQNIIE